MKLRRLQHHNRFRYSPISNRPTFTWPGGARLAVYIGLNLETFDFGQGLGAELAPRANQPDVLNYSWREYGNRVGVWRLFEMFDEIKWGPVAAIVNTACYDECPEVMDEVRRRGYEVIGHGHTNSERQGDMTEAEEKAMIDACTAEITSKEGRPPRGWLSPWISESHVTPDLLQEAGYTYTLNWAMDDMPVRMSTRSGAPLWSVPYPQEVNDIPSIVARKDGAKDFADMIMDTFDEHKRAASVDGSTEPPPLVMGIALHPYLVGQPHRLKHLRGALRHIVDRAYGDCWFTTPGKIVEYLDASGVMDEQG